MFSKGSKTPSGTAVPTPASGETARSGGTPVGGHVPSIISGDLKITGNLTSSGDIQVDGQVEGDISSRTLTVGEQAHVDGSIVAESVRICGNVSGEVKATSVVLAKTAKVDGDIAHQSLAIEAGAYVEGNIRRLEPEIASGDDAKVSVITPATSQPSGPTPVEKPKATPAEPLKAVETR